MRHPMYYQYISACNLSLTCSSRFNHHYNSITHTVVKFGQYSKIYPVVQMTCSYMEGNVPKLIVRYIFQNIPRFFCVRKKGSFRDLIRGPLVQDASTLFTRQTKQYIKLKMEQASISQKFLRCTSESFVIYHGISKFGKIRNKSGKRSTHRAENIFLKYLLCNVHEITRKI